MTWSLRYFGLQLSALAYCQFMCVLSYAFMRFAQRNLQV